MNATKRAQVPFGLRKKLMAATSMLLVAAIMLVSTSYAWFTLSTAPEITGITTSVGANGNLEIALLTTETFADTDLITSNTGDSMEAQDKTKANITWGNLVDLSNSYGLESLVLYPSALNTESSGTGEYTIKPTAPLATPTYGADGRVKALAENTVSTIRKNGAFTMTTGDTPEYGVRAVGVADNISPRQLAFNSAKSGATMYANSAADATKSAVSTHAASLMMLAMADANTNYTYKQVQAMDAIAKGVQSSLTSIVKAYANAIAATILSANSNLEDEAATELAATLVAQTNADALLTAVGTNSVPAELTQNLTALGDAQEAVATAVTKVGTILGNHSDKSEVSDATEKNTLKEDVAKVLIGDSTNIFGYDENSLPVTPLSMENAGKLNSVYLAGGAVNTVASYTGTFQVVKVTDFVEVTVFAGPKEGGTKHLTAIAAVSGLEGPGGATTSTLSEFYGYIIDFAFRTNATNSKLLLQTDAVNRVYTNDNNLKNDATKATYGGGSTATFEYTPGSGVTADMGKKLLHAMRVVFFDPVTREVYGFGLFDEAGITADGNKATGDLTIFTRTETTTTKWDLGKNAYEEKTVNTYVLKDSITIGGTVYALDNTNFADVVESYTEDGWNAAIGDGGVLKDRLATVAPTATGGDGILGQDAYTKVTKTVYAIKDTHTVGTTGAVASDTNCWNFADVQELTVDEYNALAGDDDVSRDDTVIDYDETTGDDAGVLVDLPQNEVLKMSALVYLDGDGIDNSAVGIAQSSGNLKLNLQFASNANLQPMANSALMNQTKQ